ncbi:hypothetical protein [Streptomyces sp. Da 82-17]|uniref:hypothetical protein n=1 Tax=Streptomyces sp. Da 82-17 TaxID=3377116 RepID=UPI0038D4D186
MPNLELATSQAQFANPVVWILSKGEMHEGGDIVGVYLDRDLARGAFVTEAQELHDRFSIGDAQHDNDGSLRLYGGCDWIALEPHPVVTAPQLDA